MITTGISLWSKNETNKKLKLQFYLTVKANKTAMLTMDHFYFYLQCILFKILVNNSDLYQAVETNVYWKAFTSCSPHESNCKNWARTTNLGVVLERSIVEWLFEGTCIILFVIFFYKAELDCNGDFFLPMGKIRKFSMKKLFKPHTFWHPTSSYSTVRYYILQPHRPTQEEMVLHVIVHRTHSTCYVPQCNVALCWIYQPDGVCTVVNRHRNMHTTPYSAAMVQ